MPASSAPGSPAPLRGPGTQESPIDTGVKRHSCMNYPWRQSRLGAQRPPRLALILGPHTDRAQAGEGFAGVSQRAAARGVLCGSKDEWGIWNLAQKRLCKVKILDKETSGSIILGYSKQQSSYQRLASIEVSSLYAPHPLCIFHSSIPVPLPALPPSH